MMTERVFDAATAPHGTPPDWPAIRETIRCPLCGYDLRGLDKPRCPECGYRFDWPDLLDPARRDHPFLFEQHRRHNNRSFLRTTLAQWRPRRFWSSLRPSHLIRPRRIVLYWLIVNSFIVAAFAAYAGQVCLNHVSMWAGVRAQVRQGLVSRGSTTVGRIVKQYGSVDRYLDAMFPRPSSSTLLYNTCEQLRQEVQHDTTGLFALGTIAYLLWPWLTVACVLGVFHWSARRAKIGPGHVMRAVIYSGDLGGWIGLAAIVLILLQGFHGPRVDSSLAILIALGSAFVMYRLTVAFKNYLGLDHPIITALTVQFRVLASLAVAIISIQPLLYWVITCSG